MSNIMQSHLRQFASQLLSKTNAPKTVQDAYSRFQNGDYATDDFGETDTMFQTNYQLEQGGPLRLSVNDCVAEDENFISIDISSIDRENIIYFLVNVNPDNEKTDGESEYYFTYVTNTNGLPQEGFLSKPQDCKVYLDTILEILEV